MTNFSTNHTHVRVGKTWRLKGPPVKILEHIVHPKYQLEHKFDYDVQLLKLFRALRFHKTVKPIHIGKTHDRSVFVSGWGYSKERVRQYKVYYLTISVRWYEPQKL